MPSPTKFGALEERPRHWHSIFLDPFARCCLTVINFVRSSTDLPDVDTIFLTRVKESDFCEEKVADLEEIKRCTV